MRISPRLSGSVLTFYLQTWNFGAKGVEGLKFTVDSWTGIVSGVPFAVTWTDASADSTLTLSLANGTVTSANVVNPIASGISNTNAYSWTPGVFAKPGHVFFLELAGTDGSTAFGDTFTVAASMSSLSSSTLSTTSSATATSSTQTTTTGVASTSSTQTAPAATSSATATSSSTLSTGAKAGIGIGSAVGAIALISLVIFYIMRRKQASSNRAQELGGNVPAGWTPQEKNNYAVAQPGPPAEMYGTVPGGVRQELEGSPGVRPEMGS